jgi:hypothetical protein
MRRGGRAVIKALASDFIVAQQSASSPISEQLFEAPMCPPVFRAHIHGTVTDEHF